MKAVIYSGGSRKLNHSINKRLLNLSDKEPSSLTIGYIPSCSDQDSKYYHKFKKYFSHYGIKNFYFLPLKKFNNKLEERLLKCDILYFDGGNTYEFIEELYSNKSIISALREFKRNNGIFSGQSAGALLLTHNINMAEIPLEDADENELNTRRRKALNFLKFEFCPHYENTNSQSRQLINYSKENVRKIYALMDGSGIIIDGKKEEFIGEYWVFSKGNKKKSKKS